MNAILKTIITRLLFYWVTSSLIAISIYYVLWIIMPDHYVFGTLYRMFVYHYEHPIQYIIIPCFFYGILASVLSDVFAKTKTIGKISLTFLIIIVTVLLSSPFGGMLWHYHDMQAGYFPKHWFITMVKNGFVAGLPIGWLIVGLSIPYNIVGSIVCYFLTKIGSELLRTDK